jgi:hypothetical protein
VGRRSEPKAEPSWVPVRCVARAALPRLQDAGGREEECLRKGSGRPEREVRPRCDPAPRARVMTGPCAAAPPRTTSLGPRTRRTPTPSSPSLTRAAMRASRVMKSVCFVRMPSRRLRSAACGMGGGSKVEPGRSSPSAETVACAAAALKREYVPAHNDDGRVGEVPAKITRDAAGRERCYGDHQGRFVDRGKSRRRGCGSPMRRESTRRPPGCRGAANASDQTRLATSWPAARRSPV